VPVVSEDSVRRSLVRDTMSVEVEPMRTLVVGVNGTEESLIALEWAAETVGPHGSIHAAFGLNPWTVSLIGIDGGEGLLRHGVVQGDVISQWTDHVVARVGELTTSFSTLATSRVLDEVATTHDADAIVLGSHVTLPGIPKRIGRTTNHLLRSTVHPVIVVPPRPCTPLDDGPIVVGVGHGDATRSAVRWAAALAEKRGLSVELIHATGDAPVFQAEGLLDLFRYQIHPLQRVERWQHKVLDFADLMQTMSHSELDVVMSTPPGLAAVRLDEASHGSSLLVIGRHRSLVDGGHHNAQPLRHVLTHASCPVAVIADRPDREIAVP
jgi:nucleotide-binding universal stress UspA family protein